ncbi:MAG: hypothetical protein JOS17DRAFT_734043 [Linnemannia elongata]|nr:MAG: hypothetical protein JOS17DRAFT_734043 [Linnemannia elongata]
MSLFDIPELTHLVQSHLSRHDLARCVSVNKVWNTLFTPYLWHTVTLRSATRTMSAGEALHQYAFALLLLENCLSTQQDSNSSCSLSGTVRNGKWIRVLEVQQHHLQEVCTSRHIELYGYHPPSTSYPVQNKPSFPNGPQLIFHLLQTCTRLQCLQISGRALAGRQLETWYKILRTGLPKTVIELVLDMESQVSLAESSLPLILFTHCSTNLQELSLHMTSRCSYPGHQREQHEADTEGDEGVLPSMNVLRLTCSYRNLCPPSLSRFLSRCTNIKSLHVSRLDPTWDQALTGCVHLQSLRIEAINTKSVDLLRSALRNGLPSLDSIRLGLDGYYEPVQDQGMADMLAACKRGWRSIDIPQLGPIAAEAIVKHCLTLEVLSLTKAYGLWSDTILRILSSSPKLESFVTLIDDDNRYPCSEMTHILAASFIDVDPPSGLLNPWACESTLKIFRAKISKVPRPDITQTFIGLPLTDGMVVEETYPGQSLKTQSRVYERLARLTKLERLELGHEDRNFTDAYRKFQDISELIRMDDMAHQYDCLEMSLSSGLRLLEGLKELKTLSVMRMTIVIGVEEAQWMVQNWPKLRRVNGLSPEESGDEAALRWLKVNCPWIQSRVCSNGEGLP